jgi:hypothetical protein
MKTGTTKTALTAGYLCLTLLVLGQNNSDDLFGKWKFKQIYESEKLDSARAAMMETLFAEMTFQFNENGLYKAYIMGSEEQGEWKLEEGKKVLLSSEKGVVTPLEVIELTDENFAFSLQGRPFVMAKMADAEMEVLTANKPKYETVSTGKEQVAKKWFFKSKESTTETSELVEEALSEIYKGSYLEFSADGKSESSIAGIGETATWRFGENNTSIIVSGEEGKIVWNIIGVTDIELVLVLGTTDEKWVFGLSE